jgi:hypothetical protein
MRGSAVLPWLLIGPILVGSVCVVVWQITGLEIFAVVGKLSAAIVGGVIVSAFVAARLALARRKSTPG